MDNKTREALLEPFKLQVIRAKVQVADTTTALTKAEEANEDAQKMLALSEAQYAAVEAALPKPPEETNNAEHVGS